MTTDGKHEGTPQEGEDDALWRLLERARQPKSVSSYFARRVLREVALLENDRPTALGAPHWLARRWRELFRPPGAAFACVLMAAALTVTGGTQLSSTRQPTPAADSRPEATNPNAVAVEETASPVVAEDPSNPSPTVAVSSEPVVTAQDVEVIADLDNVLSREESRLWTEDDTARF